MPELSIIVPVYKVENYLPKCVDSILAQTFGNLECLLTDDGSPDRCGEILDAYAQNDSRLIVIHQPNGGVSSARNMGLHIARGNYVGFVDSDDWIEPEMYGTMLDASDNGKYDVVICGCRYYNADYSFLRTDLCSVGEYDREELLKLLYGKPNPLGGGVINKIFHSELITNIYCREELSMAEDWIFLFDVFTKCNHAKKINNPFCCICERTDSATRKNEAKAYYDIVFGGKLLLLKSGRSYSSALEKIATDKFIDDCIRYSNIIRKIGKEKSISWRRWFLLIRVKALTVFPRALYKRLLSLNTLNGYLYELLK